MTKKILSGDEAVARGAWEAGVRLAAAYPGTPSTEILENLAKYGEDVDARWANNEKVAVEIAAGASVGGLRTLAAMKHVGVNVAADPIFAMGYAGVNGGMVIVSADDPGCHSSQNEQDNRLFAPHAKLAMVEPSDSQECKDFTIAAYEISEKFDIPVLLRMTTRVCHSKSIVALGEREDAPVRKYEAQPGKYAMLPATARARHVIREALLDALEDYACTSPLNRAELAEKPNLGIVTSGISYMHAREVFGEQASYLKLGLTCPLPRKLIQNFCSQMKTIYVIEEGEPYLENAVRALGFSCTGKDRIPIQGELDAQTVRRAFGLGAAPQLYAMQAQAPDRPPILCAGCPHRGFFYAMSRHKKELVAVGDIGCYSLGVSAPFYGFDMSFCMGSGFSSPIGLSKALEAQGDARKVFGLLGDSTFFHSGLVSMLEAVHRQANVCLCLLDNSITAMTGHQVNAGNSTDLQGHSAPPLDPMALIYAAGLETERVITVDPLDLEQIDSRTALSAHGPFVIVTQRPCVLIKEVARANAGRHCRVDPNKCVGCKACLRVACPALAFDGKHAYIADPAGCTACGLCMQMCKFSAISIEGGQI